MKYILREHLFLLKQVHCDDLNGISQVDTKGTVDAQHISKWTSVIVVLGLNYLHVGKERLSVSGGLGSLSNEPWCSSVDVWNQSHHGSKKKLISSC